MPNIYTIGYESTDIDQFVSTLLAKQVEVLVDVRAIPLSRKRGFSKKALSHCLEGAGIEYHHFPALGDPKPGRDAARAGHYDAFERIYRAHFATRHAREAFDKVQELVASRTSCLMCFERDPATCHRSIIAEALRGPALRVSDLFVDLPRHHDNFRVKGRDIGEGLTAAE